MCPACIAIAAVVAAGAAVAKKLRKPHDEEVGT
jgi:hypothetical protein